MRRRNGGTELRIESQPRAMQVAFDCSFRQIQHTSYFAHALLLQVKRCDHLPLHIRQTFQASFQFNLVQYVAAGLCCGLCYGVKCERSPVRVRTQCRQACTSGDRIQPGGRRSAAIIFGRTCQSLRKMSCVTSSAHCRLLRNITAIRNTFSSYRSRRRSNAGR